MKRALLASICAAIAISLASPSIVLADRSETKKKKKSVKSFDFTADHIEGDVVNPTGDHVNLRGWASHESLIRIRSSFTKEIIKAGEDV
jgi:hypothetical protein